MSCEDPPLRVEMTVCFPSRRQEVIYWGVQELADYVEHQATNRRPPTHLWMILKAVINVH